ncbi:AAA family ATPase [Bacillaceae bacterium Marseille-Q3522]|nr:AAA family ATPase [Bacillaceae bacterium Marseille-Q3522]
MEDALRILLVSDDETVHHPIQNALAENYQLQLIDPEDVIREINRNVQDIVIFVQPQSDTEVEIIDHIKRVNPGTLVIFIAKAADFNLLRSVTKAGTAEFFVYPDEIGTFISRFPTIYKNYEAQKNKQQDTSVTLRSGRGEIITFYSGNGGVGKSILAATFAQTLKLETNAEVLLLDLNFQLGGIETMLSIQSNRSIADLAPVIDELNENHIRNVSQKLHPSRLEVLISPCDAEVAEKITEEFIAKLLRTCRRSFDFVIVDIPAYINLHVVTALEESDHIYYVLTPTTASLTVLKHFENIAVRLGIELPSKTSVLLNKAGKENEISEKDLKDVLNFPITAVIYSDNKGLQPYINKGEPVRKEVKDKRLIPFAKDVRKWAFSYLHEKNG